MMKKGLLNKDFVYQFPEIHESEVTIPNAKLVRSKFNRWGTLLAAGGSDGRVFIYDFVAKNLVLQFQPHVHPVAALSWSRDGRKLLTASSDMMVVVSEVVGGQRLHSLYIGTLVLSASFNPRNDNQVLILPLNKAPLVETLSPKVSKVLDKPKCFDDEPVSAVTYDQKGKFIFAGTSKGNILIYDSASLQLISWCSQTNKHQIKQILIPRCGNYIITNSADRAIRIYNFLDRSTIPNGSKIQPEKELQDSINKLSWISVCTDSTGSFICGASSKKHELYIWERQSGSLVKILRNPNIENVLDIQWHPVRAVILSASDGVLTVWAPHELDHWSTFAPDFREIEENEMYKEKEGEFDLEDEDASDNEKDQKNDPGAEEIDVVGFDKEDLICSSDEEHDVSALIPSPNMTRGPLGYIPYSPEILDPEEGGFPNLAGLRTEQQLEAITIYEQEERERKIAFMQNRMVKEEDDADDEYGEE